MVPTRRVSEGYLSGDASLAHASGMMADAKSYFASGCRMPSLSFKLVLEFF